eukprot:16448186-Heterocapsa_arctica.AAC.1
MASAPALAGHCRRGRLGMRDARPRRRARRPQPASGPGPRTQLRVSRRSRRPDLPLRPDLRRRPAPS